MLSEESRRRFPWCDRIISKTNTLLTDCKLCKLNEDVSHVEERKKNSVVDFKEINLRKVNNLIVTEEESIQGTSKRNMSESSEKTISEYEKDAFEEEPIEEYVDDDVVSSASDISEISEEPELREIQTDLKVSIDDLTTSTADLDVSSNTPSDFNSDDHAFHLDFIRSSTSKLSQSGKSIPKNKNQTRYNLSFSNDRMREIERHNRILLGKILSEGQSCVPSTNQRYKFNNAPPPPPRLSSAAINRRKQQRQIDMDNQILKRKIEQIATRRTKKQSCQL